MWSPGNADKGAKDKGCPVTYQAGIGFIVLGGQHHALTPLPPGRRHGTYCTGGLVGLEVGSGWSGKYRPPPGFEPRCCYADYAILVTTRLRLPEFVDDQHMKVVRSALRTGRLYLPGDIHGTDFCQRSSRLQGHSATGRSKSMKKTQWSHREPNPRPTGL